MLRKTHRNYDIAAIYTRIKFTTYWMKVILGLRRLQFLHYESAACSVQSSDRLLADRPIVRSALR